LRDERGPWYLITGFVLGAVLGVLYAWLVSPVEYVNTSPAAMREDFKGQYRALIASAYVANRDLPRAQARLNLLGDEDVARVLAEQAQHSLAEGGSPEVAQALALLALDLGQGPTPIAEVGTPVPTAVLSTTVTPTASSVVKTPTSTPPETAPGQTEEAVPTAGPTDSPNLTQEITRTSQPTSEPLPTRTPSPTPGSPFVLQESTFVCDPEQTEPLIQVLAEDADGAGISGVEVVVSWEGGEDHFFTGLKPEFGPGYADFSMTPGVTYNLRLADGGQTITDLTPAECETSSGSRYWGSWYLLFAQPTG
jgi:hypothetical protein